jgi:hypothetical protein
MNRAVLIGMVAVLLFVVAAFCVSTWQSQDNQVATDEWVFEKYFEDRGNGVFHVEGMDWLQKGIPFAEKEELTDPTKVRTTQDVATVLGKWARRHNRRILSFYLDPADFTIIVVTEHR